MPDNIESRMDNIENNLQRLTAITLALAEHQKEFEEQTRLNRRYLDEALGTLIRMMDEWIRRNPNPGPARA